MLSEDFEQAQYLSSQVEQARQRAVLAASDAGASRDDARAAEQQAREYAKKAERVVVDVDQAVKDAQDAADRAEAPTDAMVATLAGNPVSLTRAAVDQATGDMINTGGSTTQAAGDTRWLQLTNLDGEIASLVSASTGSDTQDATDARYPIRGEVQINAADYGAVSGTNATTQIQAAINAAAAFAYKRTVIIPAGRYDCGELFVPTGVTLEGVGEVILNRVTGNNILNVTGSVGAEIELAAHLADGTKTITTTTAHGLSVGDIVYLKSQRDALSTDTSVDWRLGYATPGSGACYFAEFLTVSAINSDTSFTTTTSPVFPSYRIDTAQDTAPTARSCSTIQKVSSARDVTIRNLRISGAPANAVYALWATKLKLENVVFDTTADRPAFNISRCFSVEVSNCRVYYPQTTSTQIYLRNAFKVISSQGVDMDNCYVENGSQCFDFTYWADYGPTFHSTLRNSRTLWAQTNGATSHGGSYSLRLQNNNFDNCLGSGINIRSRESIISGNSVNRSYGSETSYGIRLYEGWAVDCNITGNIIHGFGFGIDVVDAPDQGEKFGRIGALIANNTIVNCFTGVACIRSSTNPYRGISGLNIRGNQISKPRPLGIGIHLESHVYRASVVGNTLDGNATGSTAIRLGMNNDFTRVGDNDIYRWTSRGVDHRGFDSPDLTASRVVTWGNMFSEVGSLQSDRHVATGGGTWVGHEFHGGNGPGTLKVAITGSRGGNAALAALLTRLANMGVLTDSTTA